MTIFQHINLPYEQNNIEVTNPANGEVAGYVKNMDAGCVLEIIDGAVEAQKSWQKTTAIVRSKMLHKLYELITIHSDQLAEIITLENGKVFSDAQSEIVYGASFVEWFASEAMKIRGDYFEGAKPGQKIIINYEPVGTVAAITPWNFPHAMITRKIAPALAAGCAVILKPSEITPFSALAIEYLAQEAGFPKGVFNIVTGDSDMIGKILCRDFRIRKISFTGSTNIGKLLYEQSASTLKRISLELGGNAPCIICADADINYAVECLVPAKIRSSSQACTSPNRIFIEAGIYEKVTELLSGQFSGVVAGRDIGPLINQKSIDKATRLVQDAISKGAKILCGDLKAAEVGARGNFFSPMVLVDCTDEMDIFHEEIFAPVLACYKFDNISEVVGRANNTGYGLASYIFSTNIKTIDRLSAELDFGMVGVNTAIVSNYKGAFAGRKESGFGVEGSHLGIYEYLNTKYICVE